MLEISTTAGYAILALSFIAACSGRWVLAKEISAHTGVSGPYLSKILYNLAKTGLIRAKRGYRGGFALSRPAARISVMDIVVAVEGRTQGLQCLLGLRECSDMNSCPVHRVWKATRTEILGRLKRLTLAEVARGVFDGGGCPGLSARCQTRNKQVHRAIKRAPTVTVSTGHKNPR